VPTDPLVVRFEVTEALPADVTLGEPAWITARVFAPTSPRPGRQSVLACVHGGSYDWRYYHLQIPGRAGYSMAEDMAARGHVVIAIDQLGVGESARPAAPGNATRQAAAAAGHSAMSQAFARLRDGTLHPAVPPCSDALTVGVGHSMGGMTLVTQQARFETCDLVAVLGWSNFGAHIEIGGKLVLSDIPYDPAGPGYKTLDRGRVMRSFHWDTTPANVLAADAALSVAYPARLGWEAQQACTPEDAGRIRTPVFLAMGERDVSPDPYAEPAFYAGSDDVTFFRLEQSAHCHNFAPTRGLLWSRLDRWITSLADAAG